jgi:hypothetical protein
MMLDLTAFAEVAIDVLLCSSVSAASERRREESFRFNRYDTVDRAPAVLPPPHESGRKYKYRQRFAIKTRSRMIEHEPPDILKQFVSKPWTAPPESPEEPPSPPKPKPKPKKDPPSLHNMEKDELVEELQWQHPTRTLDVGTINSNATRALAKESLPPEFLPRIKTCLSRSTQLAIKTKRTCQQAIGQYLEQLSLENLDSMDRLVLRQLCRPFTNKDVLEAEKGTAEDLTEYEATENPDGIDICEDGGKRNPAQPFFLSLLSAIYNSAPPNKKERESISVQAVRAFLIKAKDFLPLQNGQGMLFFFEILL